jgi:hypothetical protein
VVRAGQEGEAIVSAPNKETSALTVDVRLELPFKLPDDLRAYRDLVLSAAAAAFKDQRGLVTGQGGFTIDAYVTECANVVRARLPDEQEETCELALDVRLELPFKLPDDMNTIRDLVFEAAENALIHHGSFVNHRDGFTLDAFITDCENTIHTDKPPIFKGGAMRLEVELTGVPNPTGGDPLALLRAAGTPVFLDGPMQRFAKDFAEHYVMTWPITFPASADGLPFGVWTPEIAEDASTLVRALDLEHGATWEAVLARAREFAPGHRLGTRHAAIAKILHGHDGGSPAIPERIARAAKATRG